MKEDRHGMASRDFSKLFSNILNYTFTKGGIILPCVLEFIEKYSKLNEENEYDNIERKALSEFNDDCLLFVKDNKWKSDEEFRNLAIEAMWKVRNGRSYSL